MTRAFDDIAWSQDVDLTGPFSEVAFLAATWQGSPEWNDSTSWATTETPDLVYGGPPWPGLLIRLHAEPVAVIRVTVSNTRPSSTYQCIFSSIMTVDDHGFELETETTAVHVPVPKGNYPVEVWIDGDTPAMTSHCVISFGGQSPRRLGRRRP